MLKMCVWNHVFCRGEAWGSFDLSNPTRVRNALLQLVPALVDKYGELAASVAVEWYESVRAKTAGLPAYTPVLADGMFRDRLEDATRWAASCLNRQMTCPYCGRKNGHTSCMGNAEAGRICETRTNSPPQDGIKRRYTGGHMHGYNWLSGGSTFPEDWSEDDIADAIQHVLRHGETVDVSRLRGTFRGVTIEVRTRDIAVQAGKKRIARTFVKSAFPYNRDRGRRHI